MTRPLPVWARVVVTPTLLVGSATAVMACLVPLFFWMLPAAWLFIAGLLACALCMIVSAAYVAFKGSRQATWIGGSALAPLPIGYLGLNWAGLW